MRYFFETVSSWAYWRYVLFSRAGAASVFAIFGAIYLVVEALDFFGFYSRDEYAPYAVFVFLLLAIIVSVSVRRPITSIMITFPRSDFSVEVRIGDLFDAAGAIMISTNTDFESDVAGGRIAIDSLQGQFTARYFPGSQNTLIDDIAAALEKINGTAPYAMGTTVPVTTHGKTFYFTVMSQLNEQGNASSSLADIKEALQGLWAHVREAGELQELAVPVVATGRGRVQPTRRKMIEVIAESFVDASKQGRFTDRLVIVVHPDDAKKFNVNLYDVKDHLHHAIEN